MTTMAAIERFKASLTEDGQYRLLVELDPRLCDLHARPLGLHNELEPGCEAL